MLPGNFLILLEIFNEVNKFITKFAKLEIFVIAKERLEQNYVLINS